MPEPTTQKRNIFDIDAELDQIAIAFDQLEEGGTEEEVLASVMAYFGDLSDERDRKLDNYARFMAERSAIGKARKDEATRLANLAKTDENAAKRCKDWLKIMFEAKGYTKIETPLHKFWIQKNGGQRPIVITDGTDPATVDPMYQKTHVSIDMEAVRADLEDGRIEIPWAKFGEVGTSMRVK